MNKNDGHSRRHSDSETNNCSSSLYCNSRLSDRSLPVDFEVSASTVVSMSNTWNGWYGFLLIRSSSKSSGPANRRQSLKIPINATCPVWCEFWQRFLVFLARISDATLAIYSSAILSSTKRWRRCAIILACAIMPTRRGLYVRGEGPRAMLVLLWLPIINQSTRRHLLPVPIRTQYPVLLERSIILSR